MREIERILDQLNRAWGGPSWTGIDIGPLLESVTDEQARAHPIPTAHSIIELSMPHHCRMVLPLVDAP